jgi:dihydrofolate reductase
MSANKSTVTLHVVSSLDGFIARRDNNVSWLETTGPVYEKGISEESLGDVVTSIDCYVLGSRTYEHALELGWPYGETPTFVITTRDLPNTRASVQFYQGDLNALVHDRLSPQYNNIWVVGGAILCQSFLKLDLVDEIRLAIIPVLLGDGLRLFDNIDVESRWCLNDVLAFKSGIVELAYAKLPDTAKQDWSSRMNAIV